MMKKFAFISQRSINSCYNFVLNKQRTHKNFLDLLKISGLSLFIMLSGVFYLRFVSLSSTEGYFLRQANNDLSSTNFRYEIVQTETLEQIQNNWEQMYGNNQSKRIVDVRPEIVRVPSKTEFTINK